MTWSVTDDWGNASEVRIILSNNADNLEAVLHDSEKDGWETATVEAEFGGKVVTGNWATLAHHANGWREKPCPCLHVETRPTPERILIGVSHFDLDTLGGVLSLLGLRRGVSVKDDMTAHDFWSAAAFIDLNGPQRIEKIDRAFHPMFHAFWAWSESHRLVVPRDGSILDVTDFFQDAEEAIDLILDGDESMMKAGRDWASRKAELERESFVSRFGFGEFSGLVRQSTGKFVNSMYAHDGKVYDAIVGHNSETGAITLSFERPGIGNAREIMQFVFGPEAGGHEGIAGSPRNLRYILADTERVVITMKEERHELENVGFQFRR